MTESQMNSYKESMKLARDSKDIDRVLDTISIALVASMECSANHGKKLDTIHDNVTVIVEQLKDVLGLNERVQRIEAWKLSLEEQKKGAAKLMKMLVGAGLVSGGAAIGNLSAICKAILSAIGQ